MRPVFLRSLPARLVAALLLAAPPSGAAWAQQAWTVVEHEQPEEPVLLVADELEQDDRAGTVTARGNVEIARGERVLLADRVVWNRGTGLVAATGNVSLLEPSGHVLFADYVELTEDLREGVVEELRVLLEDNSRIAARSGRRTEGRRTVMRRAVYSPCDLCKEDPERPPLWQLKAREIEHDELTRDIEYKDATLELFGVPILYTPYFAHPDPTVERRTGFLTPTFGQESDLGTTARVPFYWAIAPNRDLTVAPIFLSKEGVLGSGQYRHLFRHGRLEVEGSLGAIDRRERDAVTGDEDVRRDRLRGHVKANGVLHIDEHWRARGQLYRATDDTYLRKLDFDDAGTLRSEAAAEYFNGRAYGAITASTVQELRQDVESAATPTVLPGATYSWVSRQGELGYWTVDANATVLVRDDGPESRRASLAGGWHLPYATDTGHLFGLSLSLRGDLYSVRDAPVGSRTEDGTVGRVIPRAEARWRYPLVRATETTTQLIEPRASVVLAPDDVNPRRIPNEDSSNLEFDDYNLFEPNRFPGLDRVEGGQRVDYGLRAAIFRTAGGSAEAFIGQSIAARRRDEFPSGSGLNERVSDIVGRLLLSPAEWMDVLYRFRLDKDDFALRRSELGFRLGTPLLRLTGDYVQLDSATSTTELYDRREQLRATLSSNFSEHWRAFASHRRDVESRETLQNQLGLAYEDECFIFAAVYTRDFTSDREVRPSEKLLLRVTFKTLGAVEAQQRLTGGDREDER